MRTLAEITDDARRGIEAEPKELLYAVCAYDVLLAQLKLDEQPILLKEFFIAGESCPKEYIGWANDPENEEVRAWHQAFINVDDKKD